MATTPDSPRASATAGGCYEPTCAYLQVRTPLMPESEKLLGRASFEAPFYLDIHGRPRLDYESHAVG
jgi:hypothetical protein